MRPEVLYLSGFFYQADIVSVKGKFQKLTGETGKNLRCIAPLKIFIGAVGADNGMLPAGKAGVDKGVEGAD